MEEEKIIQEEQQEVVKEEKHHKKESKKEKLLEQKLMLLEQALKDEQDKTLRLNAELQNVQRHRDKALSKLSMIGNNDLINSSPSYFNNL